MVLTFILSAIIYPSQNAISWIRSSSFSLKSIPILPIRSVSSLSTSKSIKHIIIKIISIWYYSTNVIWRKDYSGKDWWKFKFSCNGNNSEYITENMPAFAVVQSIKILVGPGYGQLGWNYPFTKRTICHVNRFYKHLWNLYGDLWSLNIELHACCNSYCIYDVMINNTRWPRCGLCGLKRIPKGHWPKS